MKKWYSSLFLFLISGLAFADSSWNVSGDPTPVTSHTDLSVAYLAQVFGTVGNSLQGTSGQMLGMLFSKLNQGVMVVAGLWLVYTIITIILRSAMDGSFMGPNKNVFWIVIRIALAFAMLIPGPMTGYNIIQDIVMKVVVEGVSLADQTWNYGLDYISGGGTLWHTPEESGGGSSIISSSQAKQILKPAESIFNAEVCMMASSMENANNNSSASGSGIVNNGQSAVTYSIVANDNNHTFNFPGVGNTKNYSANIQNSSETPNCGSVKWTSIQGATHNSNSPQLAKAALSQIVYDLLPAAKQYACANYHGGNAVCSGVDTASSAVYPDSQTAVFNGLVNYVNGVYPLNQGERANSAKLAMNWFSDAKQSGWMMAGRYYWDLSQVQAYEGAIGDMGSYAPPKSSGYSAATGQSSTLKNFMSSDSLSHAWNTYVNGSVSYPNSALKQLSNYSTASSKGDTGKHYPEVAKDAGNKILDILLGGIIGDIISLFALFSTHAGPFGMGPDPVLFLHEVGMKSIAIAGDIWVGLAGVIFGLSVATIVCQGSLNLSTPLSEVSAWIKPPLMILASALLGVGVLLGYYVPLYPFMLFIFGVIGWIISVIEAMVAGPLIAFGLTHPEGHDFLGEAKQGLVLLLGIFLRPVLMVIGLIAGMILSYVSLRILVYTYSGFLQDIFYQVGPIPGASGSIVAGAAMATINVFAGTGLTSAGSIMLGLFTFPLMLAIFATLVYVVTNQCFSLIYVLPDYILRWIGGPQQASAAGDMARQVQGAMGQMGSAAGDAGTKAVQAKQEADKEKEKSGEGAHGEGSVTEHSTAGGGDGGSSESGGASGGTPAPTA